jgi:hypothetical protein
MASIIPIPLAISTSAPALSPKPGESQIIAVLSKPSSSNSILTGVIYLVSDSPL